MIFECDFKLGLYAPCTNGDKYSKGVVKQGGIRDKKILLFHRPEGGLAQDRSATPLGRQKDLWASMEVRRRAEADANQLAAPPLGTRADFLHTGMGPKDEAAEGTITLWPRAESIGR